MRSASSRALIFPVFLAAQVVAGRAPAQGAYVRFLIDTEGPFEEQLFYVAGEPPHDIALCDPYTGGTPNNVRVWASRSLGDGADLARRAGWHFIRSGVRTGVLEETLAATPAEELAALGIADLEDLRRLICAKLFDETPEEYSTAIIALGAIQDPDAEDWVLGGAQPGIHDEEKVFFIRLSAEHLALANHGRDWVTGGNYTHYFWGGVVAHQALHALGFGPEGAGHGELAHAYGRAIAASELAESTGNRVFPPSTPGTFASSGACAHGIEPRGPYTFLRGDVDGSGGLDITDAIALLRMLFGADGGAASAELPACGHALDANDDEKLDISDPVRILTGLFLDSAMLPPTPYPDPAVDPTPGAYWGDCLWDFGG
jgi:hypothetical protein